MNSIKTLENHEMIPLIFHLSQNYPNPFNDKTVIKYCVAYKSKIAITVLNSVGEVIKNLIDEEQEAGTYEIEFDGGNLPEGVYIYQLETEGYIYKKEMNLMS